MEKMAAIRRVLRQQGLLEGTVRSHVLTTLQGPKEEHDIDMEDGMYLTDLEDVFERGDNNTDEVRHQDIGMDCQPAEGNHKELVGVSDVKLATFIRTSFVFSFKVPNGD